MCLIISAPQGKQIPLELLQDASNRNADGWGVMYHDGHKIVVEKDPKASPEAIFDLTRDNPHPMQVHLRMATHGTIAPDNTHPFEIVKDRLYMMHNGIIDVDVPLRSKKSDTRVVVDDYLRPLVGKDPSRIRNKGLVNFINTLIGRDNRLVFLDSTGETHFFNKDLGIEWHGLWCSNTYAWSLWKDKPPGTIKPRTHQSRNARQDSVWRDDFDLFDRWDDAPVIDPWVENILLMDTDELEQQSAKDLAYVVGYLRDTFNLGV